MTHSGPLLIGTGLAIILAAQIGPGIPIAAAIALIGCGATVVMQKAATVGRALHFRHQRWWHGGSLLIYAALVGLAAGAQLDLRRDALYISDAVVAIVLLLGATHIAFQRTSASNW